MAEKGSSMSAHAKASRPQRRLNEAFAPPRPAFCVCERLTEAINRLVAAPAISNGPEEEKGEKSD